MLAVSVMWKTVSEACNLACDYCYYSRCGGQPKKINLIDFGMLEKFIKEYMEFVHSSGDAAVVAWQGGEPLLAGLDFFRKVVYLQSKYAFPNMVISNSIQTNGTLITDEWAKFFKQYNFLVGVSLDGPKNIHDIRRVTHNGSGSFDHVMRGVQHLNRHHVDYNVLTVLHSGNVKQGKELIEFYRTHGFHYVQFLPMMEFQAQSIQQPATYEITPQEYGDFLCEVFDEWYQEDFPTMYERLLDSVLSVYMNRDPGYCILNKMCGQSLILEQNGDAYPCDFHIHPNWKLGNVGVDSLKDILQSERMRLFASLKPKLPEECQTCKWNSVCHGGCPRNRTQQDNGEAGTDYFCASYKQFYAYSENKMKKLALRLRKRLFYENAGMKPDIGRNDSCPCGSGGKYKHCCLGLVQLDWRTVI